jgi:hypothetical protein
MFPVLLESSGERRMGVLRVREDEEEKEEEE